MKREQVKLVLENAVDGLQPCAPLPTRSPEYGLYRSNVFLSDESTNPPLMKSWAVTGVFMVVFALQH